MLPPDNFRQKTMFAPNENYDLYMSNLEKGYEPQVVRNTLQLNHGGDVFSEIGQLAEIHQTDWSWAPLFADFDNDGLKDLFVSNGYGKDITDMDFVDFRRNLGPFSTPEDRKAQLLEIIGTLGEVKIPNYIYQNRGDLTFKDVSLDWGIVHPSISNGAVFVDLDNDGDLDLVLNNVNQTAFIYQNNLDKMPGEKHNYLKLALAGPSPNLAGIGAKITLYHSNEDTPVRQFYEHYPTRGYKSHMDQEIHFGLGQSHEVDSLEIIWPDGNIQLFNNIPANQTFKINYEDTGKKAVFEKKESAPLFTEVSKELKISHKHESKNIVDFKSQRLLPHKYSENGPGLAVADVNGDGLDDFYVGGAAGFPGTIYYQQADGSFLGKLLEEESEHDDMGALFFDANNDGHPDLYIVSGGNRYLPDAEQYQDRLYLNDGKGNFKKDPDALPILTSSGGVVTAADFDGDGDLDLFVGGRVAPRQYPLPAQSYLLRNDGGKFTDITKEVFPDLENIGMVTAALWTDFDRDGNIDLLLAGEWMPITFLKQNHLNGKRTFEMSTLPDSEGWWNSLVAGDFDGDGDIDYIAGNLGLNVRWKASTKKPLSIYAKDFDGNGSVDPIMFQYLLGKKFAVPSRGTLTSQLPFMKNRFQSYHQYGVTDFDNFFLEGELDDVYLLETSHFSTSFIENKGNGDFALHALPHEAQISLVYGMAPMDLDGDGHLDVLITGNFHGNEAVTGPYDASYGLYLKGLGDGSFAPVPIKESGFKVDGDARGLARLFDGDGQPLYLVSQFADSLKVYQPKFNPQGSSQPLIIHLGPLDQRAEIRLRNGATLHQEFYYGEGYLSQSSRKLVFGKSFESVTLVDYQGNRREIKRGDLEKK